MTNLLTITARMELGSLRSTFCAALSSALLYSLPAYSQNKVPVFTDAYDSIIEEAIHEYWADFDEPLFAKAQMYQESNLNPKVCSSAGACGFGQFMPGTWQDVIKYMHWSPDLSRFDVEDGIEAFAYYQGYQRHIWRNGRSPGDANELGQAGYNAGAGHILSAQKLCNNMRLWSDIVPPCLPKITGEANAKQTIDYTYRIRYWDCLMEGSAHCLLQH